jgi:hypothetical protein
LRFALDLTTRDDIVLRSWTALIQPSRQRIQSTVDHRFFRRKYDAVWMVERFSQAARQEVELDRLNAELVGIVRETVGPCRISLCLRQPTLSRSRQTHPLVLGASGG